ncbi:MAG: plasmid pRiA4b ORF-3 family protein [Propionicimonas sp.]
MVAEDNVIPFPAGGKRRPVEPEPSPKDVARELADRFIAETGSPAGALAALHELIGSGALGPLGIGVPAMFGAEVNRLRPRLLKRRPDRACFVVRLDLDNTKPPIWRRLRLASDLTLSELHEILQIAMGWTDSHLHQFQMGPDAKDFRVVPFLTPFDLDEGETDGTLESEVRLDQTIAKPGHRLYYEYDFGDGWEHTIKLEKIEPWAETGPVAVCVAGRRACPPEDVGGPPGYHDVLDALEGHIEPAEVEWMAERIEWLPEGFDPAAFSADEVNELLRENPLPALGDWHPEIAHLLAKAAVRGRPGLGSLVKQAVADWVELTDVQVEQATLSYRVMLSTVGAGVKLTAAGYLPPRIVENLWDELRLGSEWIGKGNREDMTLPVLILRESATALGLLRKAKGQLTVTKLGRVLADDPRALLAHIGKRLPLGREFERDAGMLELLLAAASPDVAQEGADLAGIYAGLGWRNDHGQLGSAMRYAARPSMDVLDQLTGRLPDLASRAAIAKALLRRH